MDMRAKTCCFTGHRSLSGAEKLKVAVRLRKAIKELVKQGIPNGVLDEMRSRISESIPRN